MILRPGTFLQDRYEILEQIGSGGMSVVYKAKCHKLNRLVAIKVLKEEFCNDSSFVSKFKMEAQSAAGLSHPNIVSVYDVIDEGKLHYIVMELIEGITLKSYIQKKGRLEVKETIGIAIQVAQGIAAAHEQHIIHRDIKPQNMIISKDGKVKEGDSIIFINFRPDRAREITRCFVDPAFTDVERKKGYFPVTYVCTTEYDATMPNVLVAFPHRELTNIFGEYIARQGYTQLRIAETEKYAHVTFFFNGGAEQVFPGEDRCLIPSPKVATYDLQPEMSAPEVTEEAVKRIESGNYDVIILNFANCDMVGHTGVLEAAVKAVETVDTCVGRVVEATLKMGGIAMITADHGNAEVMRQPDGSPMTAHTTNPVPFILCGAGTELRTGRLADIAPTILDVMGLACPPEMDGKSLIVR